MLMSLKPADLRTYLVVCRAIQRDKNHGRVSARQVAQRAGLSLRHAHAALEKHVSEGRLHREGKPGSTATYSLPFGFRGDNRIPTGEQLGQKNSPNCIPTGEQRSTPVGEQHCSPLGEQHLENRESLEACSPRASAPHRDQHHCDARAEFDDADLTAYQRQVLALLQKRIGTPRRLTGEDRGLCDQWQAQGIPIVTVGQAIVLGCLRKQASVVNSGGPAAKINSLKYFSNVIEEARSEGTSDYWNHQEARLKRLESSTVEAAA